MTDRIIRVLDTFISPGETTPLHAHRWPAVLHVLAWSDIVRMDREDNVVLDSRSSGMAPQPGTVLWGPALVPHKVRNVGDQQLRIIAIEIKQAP